MGQRHGAHGGLTGRGEATGDGSLRSAPWFDREQSRRQACVDGTAAREREGRAAVARSIERQRKTQSPRSARVRLARTTD